MIAREIFFCMAALALTSVDAEADNLLQQQLQDQLKRQSEASSSRQAAAALPPGTVSTVSRYGYVVINISGGVRSSFAPNAATRKIMCSGSIATFGGLGYSSQTYGSVPATITGKTYICSLTIAYKWQVDLNQYLYVGAGLSMTDSATGADATTILPMVAPFSPFPDQGATTTVQLDKVVF